MAKKRKGTEKPTETMTEKILAFGDIPANEVVEALAAEGVHTTVASVYSVRHRRNVKKGKVKGSGGASHHKKKRPTVKARAGAKAKRKPAKRRTARPVPVEAVDVEAVDVDGRTELLQLELDNASLKAQNEVLRKHLTAQH